MTLMTYYVNNSLFIIDHVRFSEQTIQVSFNEHTVMVFEINKLKWVSISSFL